MRASGATCLQVSNYVLKSKLKLADLLLHLFIIKREENINNYSVLLRECSFVYNIFFIKVRIWHTNCIVKSAC